MDKNVSKAATKKTAAETTVSVKQETIKPVEAKQETLIFETDNKPVEAKKTTKKTTAKKTAAKKTTGKKAVKSVEKVEEVYVQFAGQELLTQEVLEKAKQAYISEGHRASSIKSIRLYIKPEEHMAYYVINEKIAGGVPV